jgi:hypothetical protein
MAAEGISGEKLPRLPYVLAERSFKIRDHRLDLVVFRGDSLAAQFVNSSLQGHDGSQAISAITTIGWRNFEFRSIRESLEGAKEDP